MSFLIDTNVLSELRRKRPSPAVQSWFQVHSAPTLFLSVLTIGEIRKGIEGVSDPTRRQTLNEWLEGELPGFFSGRILPIDVAVADRWGRLVGAAGRPLSAIDSLLAATALVHGLTLATRNTQDFAGLLVPMVNPWATA